MSNNEVRFDIPINRLAWMLAVIMMPTTLTGFIGEYGLTMGIFVVSVVLSLSMASLAIGDWMVQTNRARTNAAALWLVFIGLPAMVLIEGLAYGKASFLGIACASAGYVTFGTLLLAWEGVSLVLLLVNALNAAGTAWAFGDGRLAVVFGMGSLGLGIGVSMLRGFFRQRTDARR